MREARIGLLVLALTGLVVVGMLAAASAWGAEPEVPFWNVVGARLASSSKPASIANVAGVKASLRSEIETTEIELRCASEALHEGALEGAEAKHAGKATGSLELASCKLFTKEGEAFVEDAECTVSTIKSVPLNGSLWLEGKKGEGATTVVVFEAKESPLAKITIGGCALEGSYSLTGSFAARLIPQNEEFEYIQWLQPEAAITTAWRPAGEAGETKIGLALEGNPATLQDEMKVELASHEVFGGGTEPVAGIEAPFWGLERKRLQLGEEEELKETTVPVQQTKIPRLSWKLKGTEVETRCGKLTVGTPMIEGSLNQHDGRFKAKSLKLSECTFFANEKGEFVEQKMCEVPPFSFNKLTGKLWLLGFKSERGDKPVLILGPESLTAGKSVLGTVAIKNRGSEKCPFVEENYTIEGGLITHIAPENAEASALELSVMESATHVWQSAEQEAEKQVVLSHGSERVLINAPLPFLQPKSGKTIGGGSTGVGEEEGSFNSTNGKATDAFKSGKIILEGGGATFECASAEGKGVITLGGKEAKHGNHLSLDTEKWNECKASSKEFKELKPKVKACTLRLTKAAGEAKAKGSVVSECTIETTVLFLTCTVHLTPEKEAEKVNFGLEKNVLENSGANLIIKAEDSGITTTTSGTCPGVSGGKENKMKTTTTVEGVNWA
jgi:hypothetical protein